MDCKLFSQPQCYFTFHAPPNFCTVRVVPEMLLLTNYNIVSSIMFTIFFCTMVQLFPVDVLTCSLSLCCR